ncbi:unnamed protein product, partial [Ectocarpus sp. 12 AP-2014]
PPPPYVLLDLLTHCCIEQQTLSDLQRESMKAVDTTIALFTLAALSPASAFVPSAASRAVIGRTQALPQKSQPTCSPADKSSAVFHSVKGASALFGTGPSYTDVVSETEGDEEGDEEGGKKKKKGKKSGGDKEKVKLEAEVTFFEGGPDPSEVVAPAVSILTVIGIVPFSAALARQAWVKYTLTSRRIKV